MEALLGEWTVFSAHLCKGGEKWPTQLQPRSFQGQAFITVRARGGVLIKMSTTSVVSLPARGIHVL